jgi:putative NADH-flavin reductase
MSEPMKVVVFGATGGTGRRIIEQGLEAGHRVTAVARRPSAIEVRHERLEVVEGDVLRPETLEKPVADADAVLSALGIGYSRAATTVYSEGTANIMVAMRAAGVRRLGVVSTTSLDPPPVLSDPLQWLFFRGVLHQVLRKPYADVRIMEREVRASELDWTVLRAARLTNGPCTGKYRTAFDDRIRGGWSISRADVADFLLTRIDDARTYRVAVDIAY